MGLRVVMGEERRVEVERECVEVVNRVEGVVEGGVGRASVGGAFAIAVGGVGGDVKRYLDAAAGTRMAGKHNRYCGDR